MRRNVRLGGEVFCGWNDFVVNVLVAPMDACFACLGGLSLRSEPVDGFALALERVDHVKGSHRLALGMLGESKGVPDHSLEEGLQDVTGFLVHETRKALDTTSTRKTSDGRLGDALDAVANHLAVTLGTSLARLSFTRHSFGLISLYRVCSMIAYYRTWATCLHF